MSCCRSLKQQPQRQRLFFSGSIPQRPVTISPRKVRRWRAHTRASVLGPILSEPVTSSTATYTRRIHADITHIIAPFIDCFSLRTFCARVAKHIHECTHLMCARSCVYVAVRIVLCENNTSASHVQREKVVNIPTKCTASEKEVEEKTRHDRHVWR